MHEIRRTGARLIPLWTATLYDLCSPVAVTPFMRNVTSVVPSIENVDHRNRVTSNVKPCPALPKLTNPEDCDMRAFGWEATARFSFLRVGRAARLTSCHPEAPSKTKER